MSLRVYVSGASAELPELEAIAASIRAGVPGVIVADRWMVEVAALRALGMGDADLSTADARKAAQADLLDVQDCDAFVFVVPSKPSLGAWVELGYALARRPHRGIYALGDLSRSIFLRDLRVLPVVDVAALVRVLRAPGMRAEWRRPS